MSQTITMMAMGQAARCHEDRWTCGMHETTEHGILAGCWEVCNGGDESHRADRVRQCRDLRVS